MLPSIDHSESHILKIPNGNYTMVLAPTGIAAYHVKGNTLHSGLHININTKELSSLNGDALARLQQKYINVKVLFLEEVSMIGRELMKKVNKRLQQIFGTTSIFGKFTCDCNWRFLPNGSSSRLICILRTLPTRYT